LPVVTRTGFTLALLVAAGWLGGCGGATKPPVEQFVAADSDVADFWTWYTQPFVADAVADIVYPPGSRVGFLNHRPPAGTTSYPLGTIIVKAIENDNVPANWELFGIAKRGGDYNAAGAHGWEFLLLRVDDGVAHIYSRGLTPTVDGRADMVVNEGSYFAGGQVACDVCHGQKMYAPTDFIIDTPLAPQTAALPATP
jgi:hypothetical protein